MAKPQITLDGVVIGMNFNSSTIPQTIDGKSIPTQVVNLGMIVKGSNGTTYTVVVPDYRGQFAGLMNNVIKQVKDNTIRVTGSRLGEPNHISPDRIEVYGVTDNYGKHWTYHAP